MAVIELDESYPHNNGINFLGYNLVMEDKWVPQDVCSSPYVHETNPN